MIRYTQKFGKEWKHDHKNFAERKVNMDRNAPIGVFDSGIGGLTVAREIMRQMPQERIVYFGDTARVPYGSKSQETVLRYSRQIIRFLKTQGVKAIVIACNTASGVCTGDGQTGIGYPDHRGYLRGRAHGCRGNP